MNCHEARQAWHDQLDGVSPSGGMEHHLKTCAECRRYVADMTSLVGVLDSLREDTDAVRSKHVPGSHGVARDRNAWPWFMRTVLAAAAIIAVALLAWPLLERSRPTDRLVQRPRPEPSDASVRTEQPQATQRDAPELTLQGDSADRFLVLADSGHDPNVTVFRLYPVLARAEPASTP